MLFVIILPADRGADCWTSPGWSPWAAATEIGRSQLRSGEPLIADPRSHNVRDDVFGHLAHLAEAEIEVVVVQLVPQGVVGLQRGRHGHGLPGGLQLIFDGGSNCQRNE